MQIKDSNGFSFKGNSKSNMSEFSSNPDSRNKSDISIENHKKLILENEDIERSFRVKINKQRIKNGLYTFKDSEKFEDIIEDCELEGKPLTNFLLQYNEEDELTTIASEEQSSYISKTTLIQGEIYIDSFQLSNSFNMNNIDMIDLFKEQGDKLKYMYVPSGHKIHYKLSPINNSERYYVPLTLITYITVNNDLSIKSMNSLLPIIIKLYETNNKLHKPVKRVNIIPSFYENFHMYFDKIFPPQHKYSLINELLGSLKNKLSKLKEKN